MKNEEKPLIIYAHLQDPSVAKEGPLFGFQKIEIKAEFNLSDGPTSSRFAVVDYNGTTGLLMPPVKWEAKKKQFKSGSLILNNQQERTDSFQFHQLSVWAIVQNTLHFFEDGQVMGRKLPWGFEGNQLIVVPHAGYGQNAYYDRQSKSLQFYFYSDPEAQQPVYTCLSADIVNHELGHAILDGIRPHFNESTHIQTAAFHEFFGDLTAILMLLRNNPFRETIARNFGPNLSEVAVLSGIAEEFGRTVEHRPFLRSARNNKTMASVGDSDDPHDLSEVLTAAMFDLLIQISKLYIKRGTDWNEEDQVDINSQAAHKAAKQAFWYTIYRMQRMALQPLDFLPPVDVTFRDYALAVLRTEQLSNPTDPFGYRKIMFDVFVKRGILSPEEEDSLLKPRYLYDRNQPRLHYKPSIFEITQSRTTAFQFLDGNRSSLGIPPQPDIIVTDLYECNKQTR
ncbi:MAG: serine protease, partial [Saprospiraceae bacterium]